MSDSKTPASPSPATAAAPPEAKFEWTHSPFEAFLERHFKVLVLVLGLAAVGVAGWLVWQQRQEEQRTRQGEAFAGAETLEDYKKVIANYPGSAAAGSAQFMIANLLAQNNDTAGAIEELQKFASTYPSHPLTDQAAFRMAVLTIDKGDTKAGLEKLESFIKEFPQSPLRGLAQLRRADGLAATGERDKAAELYQAILADTALAGNAVRTDAENRVAKVKFKPPVEVEFVPEPTPPTPAPGAPPTAQNWRVSDGVPPTSPPAGPPTAPGALSTDISVPSLGLDAPPPAEPPIIPQLPVPVTPPALPPSPPK